MEHPRYKIVEVLEQGGSFTSGMVLPYGEYVGPRNGILDHIKSRIGLTPKCVLCGQKHELKDLREYIKVFGLWEHPDQLIKNVFRPCCITVLQPQNEDLRQDIIEWAINWMKVMVQEGKDKDGSFKETIENIEKYGREKL